MRFNPNIPGQPAPHQVLDIQLARALGFTSIDARHRTHKPLFDHTIVQPFRQELEDRRNREVMNLGVAEPEEDETILNVDSCEDIMVEVTLDSSACRHVMARENAPGYSVQDSSASRRGLGFIVGSGERISN